MYAHKTRFVLYLSCKRPRSRSCIFCGYIRTCRQRVRFLLPSPSHTIAVDTCMMLCGQILRALDYIDYARVAAWCSQGLMTQFHDSCALHHPVLRQSPRLLLRSEFCAKYAGMPNKFTSSRQRQLTRLRKLVASPALLRAYKGPRALVGSFPTSTYNNIQLT